MSNVSSGPGNAPDTPHAGAPADVAATRPQTGATEPGGEQDAPDVIVIHPVTGVPTEPADDPAAPTVTADAGPDSSGRQRDRRQDGPFPSAEQVREVVDILKDAGERIQRVLDRPKG